MDSRFVTVSGFAPTAIDTTNVRHEAWGFALDQRCCGPRKTLVAFADADGTFRGLAVTDRRTIPHESLGPCVQHLGVGAAAAVVFCDERVDDDPPDDLEDRFVVAKETLAAYGVHLVDWFMCDDDRFRSMRYALGCAVDEWWDVPGG